MNNDSIKLLKLENININLEKSDITKINNILHCNIVLNTINEHCPECWSTEYQIKDYQLKTIDDIISTSSPCIIKYKARRYKCKYCIYFSLLKLYHYHSHLPIEKTVYLYDFLHI